MMHKKQIEDLRAKAFRLSAKHKKATNESERLDFAADVIEKLADENATLTARAEKAEAEIYSLECLSSGFGVSVNTMLELGKSYVKMAQDNICLIEDIQRIMAERDTAVGIGDSLCEELENCYGRETELTERWHGKGV